MGPHAPTRPGRHGRLVLEPAAESLAPGSRRAAPGQHVHDLAHPARGRPELAEEPHLVRNRRGDAQAHARRGVRLSDPDTTAKKTRSAKLAGMSAAPVR